MALTESGRQVPPDALGVRVRGRPVRSLAAGPRVRAVLWVPWRRHQPVVSGPALRQPSGRATADPGAGLPPDRGPCGQSAPGANRTHAITAEAEIPAGGAEGVLLCQGSAVGGWSFYMKGGALHYAHNYVRRAIYRVSAPDPVPAGRHELRFEFEPTEEPDIAHGRGAPGRAQLYIDGHLVGQSEIPVTTPVVFNPGGLTCGANPGSPVVPDYRPPFQFTGTLHTVTVDLSGDLVVDHDSDMRLAMSRQ